MKKLKTFRTCSPGDLIRLIDCDEKIVEDAAIFIKSGTFTFHALFNDSTLDECSIYPGDGIFILSRA